MKGVINRVPLQDQGIQCPTSPCNDTVEVENGLIVSNEADFFVP
jgi:hypothetical protein